jgi:hypothetical protein
MRRYGSATTRSETLSDLGEDLGGHLCDVSRGPERAGTELDRGAEDHERDLEVQALRAIDVLGAVLALARPLADR